MNSKLVVSNISLPVGEVPESVCLDGKEMCLLTMSSALLPYVRNNSNADSLVSGL
jgi:hypothetical protein